ncbi:MAG: hypothetical protein Ta2D_10660 [Rickettsiales bacterium]|nr:MAG: hypothetical protein Ta2D_10660 [Rickettsiales bacterium]
MIKNLIFHIVFFKKMYNDNSDKKGLIEIFVDIGENKVVIFTFNNEKEIEKELYEIINSLHRYDREIKDAKNEYKRLLRQDTINNLDNNPLVKVVKSLNY